ncbi:VOC family protein [Chryseobacterium vrystaatense]|uniref:Lactoylglutathione lyase n=1 Tax=Chryseobacterium vrystaatense TaxID=307480 RepID=A0A1M5END3_9FLAO|nr:VOC family protein [Chryseobacterium vrystaatense]SHF80610.1 lactoylglutathione lyase [Chryseobacterium vrystaatense]
MKIKIEHYAVWCKDPELMRTFYMTYFGMFSNDRYINPVKKYESYFLSFEGNSSPRLELMKRPDIIENKEVRGLMMGYAHIAFSVGSKAAVDILTEKFRQDGYSIVSETRVTGDGYYESVIEDPEGNWIEITE